MGHKESVCPQTFFFSFVFFVCSEVQPNERRALLSILLHAFAVIDCHQAFIFVCTLDDLLRKWKVCEQLRVSHTAANTFFLVYFVYSTDPERIKAEGDKLLYGNIGDFYLVK